MRISRPDSLARLAQFVEESGAALVSGVPVEETRGFMEKLIVPLIHFVLLAFLPLRRMRTSTDPRFGAACGQIVVVRRDAYEVWADTPRSPDRIHDGCRTSPPFRAHGFATDLFDATDTFHCRMYRTASEVWNGFAKNAHEGLGSPRINCAGDAAACSADKYFRSVCSQSHRRRSCSPSQSSARPPCSSRASSRPCAFSPIASRCVASSVRDLRAARDPVVRFLPLTPPTPSRLERPLLLSRTRDMKLLLLALVLSTAALAAPVKKLNDFELTDQNSQTRTYRFPKSKVTVMTVADHKGSDELAPWIQRLTIATKKRSTSTA